MSWLGQLGREPLLHFLLLGAALFALEAAATREQGAESERVIVISPDFVTALGRRAEAPEDADEEGLVRAFVRDEALYREAKRLGLDEGDMIVRRRLVQKMEFLLRGLAELPEPSDDELEGFLHAHASLFETPARVWFDEVFFDGAEADQRARVALAELVRDADMERPERLGDPRPGGYGGQGVTRAQLRARRSPEFASALFDAPLGRWSGPVATALGRHLVRVRRREEAQLPALASVRARVLQAYEENARRRAFEAAAERVVARYRVERRDEEAAP